MVCCTMIAALLALLLRPFISLRGKPLAWRLGEAPPPPTASTLFGGRAQSFAHAMAGLRFVIRNEPNMRIHLGAAALAVAAGLLFGLDAADWRWLVLAIGLVLAAEALNTGVEQCCNAISREFNPAIKAAKDVAAGGVLICALCAALIGLSIFAPRLAALGGHGLLDLHARMCGAAS